MKLGCRTILPGAALLVYIALVCFGCPHLDMLLRGDTSDCAGTPLSTADELAYGLNLPAAIVWDRVGPSVTPLLHLSCAGAAVADHAGTALLIPFVWYIVGWRIERWKDLRSRPYTTVGRVGAFFAVVALTCIAGLVPVSLVMASVTYPLFSAFMFAWPVFGIAASVSRLRGTARAEAAARRAAAEKEAERARDILEP